MKKLYSLAILFLSISGAAMAQCSITSSVITPSGLSVSATTTGTGASFAGYGWDWGDATTPTYSASPTASHTYASAGTYSVCAYYVDVQDTSCYAQDCQNVTVSAVGIQEANGGVSTITASPNPFGATTTFMVSLAKNTDVEISVYDVTGQKVETVKDEVMGAGNHAIVWTPATLADGVYFVQMVIDGQTTTKRIVHTTTH
jgi:hypothetical protein